MPEQVPDWLKSAEAGAASDARHLRVLRELLQRDYLRQADWAFALQDLARMAKEALGADRTLVALRHAAEGTWSAITAEGTLLSNRDISDHGSFSVLEAVRQREQPILTSGTQRLDVDSESLRRQRVESVLAVPLSFWDVSRAGSARSLGGCLYAHRTADREPFTESDIALMLDLARMAEPTLNMLRHLNTVETTLAASREEVEEWRERAAGRFRLGDYESRDPWFSRNVIETLRRVAQADRVGLLILGPTGSGKSHLARAYHGECRRREGPFVTLDCSQVTSSETLSAELFGYAPTSGYANAPPRGRPGKAQLAHRGTLFIDEIGSLPSDLQQRLLRLIQEGTYAPLGGSDETSVDIQVIAATSEDLDRLVRERRFREDLYWRIREITVRLPPLSKRPADIPALAETLLSRACARYGRAALSLSEAALRRLIAHDWSRAGNIRGLEHTCNRTVLLAPPELRELDAGHIELDALFAYGRPEAEDAEPQPGAPVSASARPVRRKDLDETALASLRDLLRAKAEQYGGTVASMAADPDVAAALGYPTGPVPTSSLSVWLQDLALDDHVQAERRRRRSDADVDDIKAAVREHGSGTAAAKALGITRDTLVHRLRKAGLSIGDVLPGAS